jgi:hypothetical protein
MRLPLLLCVTTLAATAVLAQQAGQTTPSSPSSKSTQPGQTDRSSQPGVSSSQSTPSSIYSATGRGAGYAGQQQHFRSTKIIGAQVKSSTGEEIGRIEEVVLNPTSGRIDFAVISAESKLVPVPWQLLSVSPSSGASAQGSTSSSSTSTSGTSTSTDPTSTATPGASGTYAAATAGGQQPTFTLNVEKSKLQAGPSFDRSRWPEMSASWSQRIYSHFGVSPSAVGGTGAGSFRSPSSQGSSTTPDQGSTGTSTDSSSGKANSTDPSKSSSDDKK